MLNEKVREIRGKFLSESLESKVKQIRQILTKLDGCCVKFFKDMVGKFSKTASMKDILRECFKTSLEISGIRSMNYSKVSVAKLSSFLLFEKFLSKCEKDVFEDFNKFVDAITVFSLFEAVKEIPTWRYWFVDGDVGTLAGIKWRTDIEGLVEKLRYSLICFPHFSPSTANMFIYLIIKCYKLWKVPYNLLRVSYFAGLVKIILKLKLINRKITRSHTFSSHHYIALQELGRTICLKDPTKLLVLEYINRIFCKNKKCKECNLNKLCG